MKRQAERANPAQVEQHIQRQRDLGEKMIGGHDRALWPELLATGATLILIVLSAFHAWPDALWRWLQP